MTWVIGGTAIHSCYCLADIQATLKFNNGRTEYFDIVQKLHMVSPHIMIAFAGDIKIGLCTIAHMKKYYEKNRDRDRHLLANPRLVADKLLNKIYYCYEKNYNPRLPERVEFLVCIYPYHIFLSSLAAHNDEIVNYMKKKEKDGSPIDMELIDLLKRLPGYDSFHNTSHQAQCLSFVYVPKSHLIMPKLNELVHLGSGGAIQEYLDLGESYSSPYMIEKNHNGGKDNLIIATAPYLGRIISQAAQELSHKGISKYMHRGILSNLGCEIKPSQAQDFPKTVDNWDDFVKLMGKKISPWPNVRQMRNIFRQNMNGG